MQAYNVCKQWALSQPVMSLCSRLCSWTKGFKILNTSLNVYIIFLPTKYYLAFKYILEAKCHLTYKEYDLQSN